MTAAKYTRVLLCVLVAIAAFVANCFAKPTDIKFPVLEINSRTFTNVTVTTVERDFICLMHSRGMESIRVEELPADLRKQLGCDSIPKPVKVESPPIVVDERGEASGDDNLLSAHVEKWWYKSFSGGIRTEAARNWLMPRSC